MLTCCRWSLVAACLLLSSGIRLSHARVAKPMSLDFFVELLYTAVGETSGDDDAENVSEQDWQEHTNDNWARAATLDQTLGAAFPFIICNEDADTNAAQRKLDIATQALPPTVYSPGSDLARFFGAVYNTDDTTCLIGLVNGTTAADLPFVVQPISFLMKINTGSVEFTDEAADDGILQYSIYYCPGIEWATEISSRQNWALEALRTVAQGIDELVTVPEAQVYETELLELKAVLDNDPTFCDALLLESVEAEDAGGDIDTGANSAYTILTFREDTTVSARNGDGSFSKVCFNLLTFALAYAPEICYIERRVPFETANLEAQWIGQSGVPEYRPFFDEGIAGKGQVIAVSDTGLDLNSCYFRDSSGPVPFGSNFFDLSKRKVVQYVDYVNGGEDINGHGSHVAGTIAGRKSSDGSTNEDGFVDGVAKDAKLAFFDIGKDDENAGLLVPSARSLLNPGKRAGARIHSASWGSNSEFYTTMDADFDDYLYKDRKMLLIVAAGNEGPGPGTIRSPAHAKNVLTVGASNSAENDIPKGDVPVDELAGFSSTGPTMDKRIKPDIVASGRYILSVGSRTGESCDPPLESQLPGPGGESPVEFGILSLQGTSMATPVVSGHAALVRQYFLEGWQGDGTKGSAPGEDISGPLLKAILINGAQPLAGYGLNEVDTKQGFGRLSLLDSLPLKGHNDLDSGFFDQDIVQNTTNTYEFSIENEKSCSGDSELSVTIVWADPKGAIGCQNCVLDNLDLFAIQTSNGTKTEHFPNGLNEPDKVNNVERIRIKAAPGDEFVVTVSAKNLQDGEQTYSLAVVYGCLNHRDRLGLTQSAGRADKTASYAAWFLSFVAFMVLTVTV